MGEQPQTHYSPCKQHGLPVVISNASILIFVYLPLSSELGLERRVLFSKASQIPQHSQANPWNRLNVSISQNSKNTSDCCGRNKGQRNVCCSTRKIQSHHRNYGCIIQWGFYLSSAGMMDRSLNLITASTFNNVALVVSHSMFTQGRSRCT